MEHVRCFIAGHRLSESFENACGTAYFLWRTKISGGVLKV